MIKVYEFMERAGFRNQTEFAKKLNLTQSAISAWVSGARAPTYETCKELLKMGMTVQELFGDDIAQSVGEPPKASDGKSFNDFCEGLRQLLEKIGKNP